MRFAQYGKITKDAETEKISRKDAKAQRFKTKADLNSKEATQRQSLFSKKRFDGDRSTVARERRGITSTWVREYGYRIRYASGRAKEQFGLSSALIRPDGMIAWASGNDPDYSELQNAAARWLMKEPM